VFPVRVGVLSEYLGKGALLCGRYVDLGPYRWVGMKCGMQACLTKHQREDVVIGTKTQRSRLLDLVVAMFCRRWWYRG
jgi:hypothetical protein